jgi:hypothetical protein
VVEGGGLENQKALLTRSENLGLYMQCQPLTDSVSRCVLTGLSPF